MSDQKKNSEKEQKNPSQTEQQNNKLDIGNELSIGSVGGSGVSDFNPDKDLPETEEKEYREDGFQGDDQRSAENGINPEPSQIEPRNITGKNDHNIENADEDKLNPYPDELKPDDDDEHFNSTWMMSGRNKKI